MVSRGDDLKAMPIEALLRYVDRSNPEVAALAHHLESELSRVSAARARAAALREKFDAGHG